MPKFGRLQPVELRKAWPNEAQDFTPWVAEEETLALLGEVLGMELELKDQEVNVGSFRADILCEDILCENEADSKVVIENQLNETDHDHLGKILTYSAVLNAHTVIWIAEKFKEEHRAALDRQNEITDARFRYFGIEIKVWKIGNSDPAPEFNIVSKPNDWIPSIRWQNLDSWKAEFWAGLKEYFHEKDLNFNIRIPGDKNSVYFGIGHRSFGLQARLSQQKKRISVRLIIWDEEDATAYFHLLKEKQTEIESALNEELEWEELPRRKTCAASLHKTETDPRDRDNWKNQFEWIASKLTEFSEIFKTIIQELDPADWDPSEEENVQGITIPPVLPDTG